MNKINKPIRIAAFTFVALAILTAPQANAAFKISVFGAGSLMDLNTSGTGATDTDSAKLGIGGGAGVEIESIAVDVIFNNRQSSGSNSSTLKMTQLQIPVQYRFNVGPAWINAGPYLGIGLGSVRTIAADGTESSTPYGAATYSGTEIGGVAGVGVGISSFFLEARYSMAFTSIYGSTVQTVLDLMGSDLSSKWRGAQILAGITF